MQLISAFVLALPLALATPVQLARRTTSTTGYVSGSDEANDVTDGVCADLTVIFARGSFELGNVGDVVGPEMFEDLATSLDDKVVLQGVNYAADLAGDLDLGAEGAPDLATIVSTALSQCPDTKLALSGYSQGALVIHYALENDLISADDVDAIVCFGDPEDGKSFTGVSTDIVKEYCATGDTICELDSLIVSAAHLTYFVDASAAAAYIISTTGVSS